MGLPLQKVPITSGCPLQLLGCFFEHIACWPTPYCFPLAIAIMSSSTMSSMLRKLGGESLLRRLMNEDIESVGGEFSPP